jgi:hypothetical protein
MKKDVGAIIMTTIFALILLGNLPAVLCHSVGVKSGDWIEYDLQEPPEERTQRIEFEGVSATVLTLNITDITLGTDIMPSTEIYSASIEINLTTTDDSLTSSFLSARALIIPNDTSVNDSVYLGEFGNEKILGETTRTYAESARTVIYANFTFQLNQYTLYWDKQTGVLLEGTKSYGPLYWSLSAVDTNMWTGGIGWWFWIIIAVVIACGILSTKRNAIRKLWRKPDATGTSKTPAK